MTAPPRRCSPEAADERTIAALGALGNQWRAARPDRQARTHLDRSDFDAIRSTGYLRAAVSAEDGGTWRGTAGSVRAVSDMLRTLGAADPSVALVASMHPAVLAFWLTAPDSDDRDWHRQQRAVVATATAGQQWGTMTSEPGSGGDILRTRAVANPIGGGGELPGRRYAITGVKHFASGTGVTHWMITTAVPDGEDEPALFVLHVRDLSLDGSSGLTLTAEWDGIGMAATQSHALRLDDLPAVRFGASCSLVETSVAANPFILTLFTSVIVGVIDEAIVVARDHLRTRTDELRAYERVEWVHAERRHWLAEQALNGSIAAVESGDPVRSIHAALRAKQSVAELAEDILVGMSRVVGGGSFSLRSPFSHWYQDVRSLGFLRPSWGLADDQLFDTSW